MGDYYMIVCLCRYMSSFIACNKNEITSRGLWRAHFMTRSKITLLLSIYKFVESSETADASAKAGTGKTNNLMV